MTAPAAACRSTRSAGSAARCAGWLAAGLAGGFAAPTQASTTALPPDFPLSPVTWGGLGGAGSVEGCGPLRHHPVILVHADGEGPEVWTAGADGGAAGALARAGFGPCEVWALRLGEQGRPLRSLEELTDDLKYFMGSVLAYTRAPRVQILARGEGAVLAHTALRKYQLYALVHAAVYVDGPFQGVLGCDTASCLGGAVRCCALAPGSLLLRRALRPIEAPEALTVAPDQGRRGRIRYLCLGTSGRTALPERTPVEGGWMLDGAANLSFPALAGRPLPEVSEAWEVIVAALADPTRACDPSYDRDGDGFCPPDHDGADCDDGQRGVHPGAEEIEADGIDQDCNGFDTDRGTPGWACERPLQATPAPTPAPEEEPLWRQPWIWLLALCTAALAVAAWIVGRGGRRKRSGTGRTKALSRR